MTYFIAWALTWYGLSIPSGMIIGVIVGKRKSYYNISNTQCISIKNSLDHEYTSLNLNLEHLSIPIHNFYDDAAS